MGTFQNTLKNSYPNNPRFNTLFVSPVYFQNLGSFYIPVNPIREYMSNYDHQGMKKIQAWIPLETWDKLNSLGYTSPTIAVTDAFKLLIEKSPENPNESQQIPGLKATIEGLREIIKEKDRSIERLENDLTRADQREDDLKQMHNNYMLQVQSLINQKAIGSPTKGHQPERKTPARKEEETGQEESLREDSAEQGEKEPIRKECRNCREISH